MNPLHRTLNRIKAQEASMTEDEYAAWTLSRRRPSLWQRIRSAFARLFV